MLKSSVFSPSSQHPLGPVLHFRSSECSHRRFLPHLSLLLRALVGLYVWVYFIAWIEFNWVLPRVHLAKGMGVCAHHCVSQSPLRNARGKWAAPEKAALAVTQPVPLGALCSAFSLCWCCRWGISSLLALLCTQPASLRVLQCLAVCPCLCPESPQCLVGTSLTVLSFSGLLCGSALGRIGAT